MSFGFSQSVVDPVIFNVTRSGLLYILAVYVDDCILVFRNVPFFISFKTAFTTCVDIEDTGLVA